MIIHGVLHRRRKIIHALLRLEKRRVAGIKPDFITVAVRRADQHLDWIVTNVCVALVPLVSYGFQGFQYGLMKRGIHLFHHGYHAVLKYL